MYTSYDAVNLHQSVHINETVTPLSNTLNYYTEEIKTRTK